MKSRLTIAATDTVIMACRVALLLLVTATFAVLWSGDQSDQIAALDRPAKLLIVKAGRMRRIELVRKSLRENESSVHPTPRGSNDQQMISPLPPGIAAGTYLVADQYGRTEMRWVTPEDAIPAAAERDQPTNHYVVESGSARWHFVRLDPHGRERNAMSPETDSAIH